MAGSSMKMGDKFAVALQCGHNGQQEGTNCNICGAQIPVQEERKSNELQSKE